MGILAKLNFLRRFLCSLIIFIVFSGVTRAQSTLEYATLTGSVAAAAKANKEKAQNQNQEESQASSTGASDSDWVGGTMAKLYGENSQVMSSKAGSLLGQIGGGALSNQTRPVTIPEITTSSQETKITEPENKNPTAANLAPSSLNTQTDSSVKVYLKSGHVVKGKIAEQRDNYIKIDLDGIMVTFFKEEIDRIEKSS